jgi:hypothetical protein
MCGWYLTSIIKSVLNVIELRSPATWQSPRLKSEIASPGKPHKYRGYFENKSAGIAMTVTKV